MSKQRQLLFIAWDGAGPHYMLGLFMPILARLIKHGYEVSILQLSSIPADKVAIIQQLSIDLGVKYQSITIERKASGFFSAILRGISALRQYQKDHPGAIIMPRSFMPAMLLRMAGLRKSTLVYDADGLALDERLDFAGWTESSLRYKFFRRIEHWALSNAMIVLVRSEKAKDTLLERYDFLKKEQLFKVINGKDKGLFKPLETAERLEAREALGVEHDKVLVIYCGTIAPQYCLDEMMDWYGRLREGEPNTKFLFLTGQQDAVKAHPEYAAYSQHILLKTVLAEEVPYYLGAADVALAFRRPTFSMKGVAPIKIGEYLLCGLPVVCSKGIGDTEEELEGLGAVMVIDECNKEELYASVTNYLENRTGTLKAPVAHATDAGGELYSLEATEKSYMLGLEHV